MTSTVSQEAALLHLKRIKPSDGWSLQYKQETVRLCRRSVPLTDNYFLDIHHDPASDSVVGILTSGKTGKAQAQVLVDARGNPNGRKVNLVQVSSWKLERTSRRSSSASLVSPEQNAELLKYGLYALGTMVAVRVIFQTMFVLYILAFPICYLYLVQTCPSEASFDTKKELKRVLRGHHLPEEHPDKPKGFLSQTLARLNATVATELATGLSGYEVTMISLVGAAIVCCVRVPSANMDFYWLGASGKWVYVWSVEIDADKTKVE